MKKNAKWIAWLLALWLLTGCAQKTKTTVPELIEPAGVQSDLATAYIGEIYKTTYYDASVKPYVESLAFKVSGQVAEVNYYDGTTVKKDDVLVKLDQADLQKRSEQLQQDIEYIRQNGEYAEEIGELDVDILEAELRRLKDNETALKEKETELTETKAALLEEETALKASETELTAKAAALKETLTTPEESSTGSDESTATPEESSAITETSAAATEEPSVEAEGSADSEESAVETEESTGETETSSPALIEKEIELLEKEIALVQNERTIVAAELAQAEADLALTAEEITLAAKEIALKENEITQKETLLRQEKEMRELELTNKRKELSEISTSLEESVIRAPFDGSIVYSDSLMPGSYVSAEDPVIFLADNTKLSVVCEYIPESNIEFADRVYAQIGAKQYELQYVPVDPDEHVQKTLAGEEDYTTFEIVATEEEWKEIEAGQYAGIYLQSFYNANALLVPTGAVQKDADNNKYVYVDQDGVRVKKAVKTGTMTLAVTEIVEGLKEGDVVYVKE